MRLHLWRLRVALILFALSCVGQGMAALELKTTRESDDDLALIGPLGTIPAGETRYVTRTALAALPGVIKLREKLLPSFAVTDLTVLPFTALLAELPLGKGMDGLLLACSDRWESVLPAAFIKSHEPFILLYYEGRSPAEGWPRFSEIEGLAPYFVSVSTVAFPKFDWIIDEGMISATQVVSVQPVNVEQHFAPFYADKLATLTEKASAGRKIFIRHCNNCHEGPGGVGGNTSQRPLMLLQVHATLNEDFFRKMVTRPKDFYPNTLMPPHPFFTEQTFAELIAFLRETRELIPPPSS